MPSLFDPQVRTSILDRITRLTADHKPVWERFIVPEMVCHVSSGLRQGLGDLDAGPPNGPFTRFPMNWLVIHVVPWPKGKAKSPREFLATLPTTWTADVSQLRDLVRRFGARGAAPPGPPSRGFGPVFCQGGGGIQTQTPINKPRAFWR